MLGEPNVQRDQRIGEIDEATHQRSDEEMTADLGIVQGQRLEPIDPIRQTELNLHGLENDVVVALGQTITDAALEGIAGNPANESWVQHGLRLHEQHSEAQLHRNQTCPNRHHFRGKSTISAW